MSDTKPTLLDYLFSLLYGLVLAVIVIGGGLVMSMFSR